MATMMKPGTICTFNSHLKELPIFDSSSLRPSLRNSGFNHRNVNLKQARNASLVPVIRAQASPGSCFPISLLLFTKTNSWVLNVFSDLVQNTIWVSLSLSFVLFARRLFPGLQVLQGGSNSKVQKLLFISLFHSYVFVLIHYRSCMSVFMSLLGLTVSDFFCNFVGRDRPWRVPQVSTVSKCTIGIALII